MKIPQKLTILDGAMGMDGGSISLMGKDPYGNVIQISLDWSLEAQVNGTTKLSLNGIPVEKRSREEERLLDVLENAEIQISEGYESGDSGSFQGVALGEDINQYLSSIEEEPNAAVRNLIEQLIANVTSERHSGVEPLGNQTNKLPEFQGPCSICGKPGYVHQLPGLPVSDIRCEKHTRTRTFNPIIMSLNLVVLLGVGLLIYFVFILIKKLF